MTTRADGVARAMPWLVVTGVLVAALSLRGPIVAPTPVLRDIEADLGIGAATAGLLTTAPVLMFALLTPVAALVIRRAGAESALLASLCGILLGTFIRALPGFGSMLAGMVVIGASITIGNVGIPVIIRRDVAPERVATVTAAYTATLNVGSLLTASLTAPLAQSIGWSAALVVWSVLTIGGIALWIVHLRRSARDGDRYSGTPPAAPARRPTADVVSLTGPLPTIVNVRAERSLVRRPIAWLLVSAFGLQVAMYYGLTTWLPALTEDRLGVSVAAAGALASIFQGAGVAGAFVVPLLARFAPPFVAPLTICTSWVVTTVGILLAPELLWMWLVVGGIGHAGGFVVIFSALVAVSRSDSEAAGMSALVQGGGYGIGAIGAPLIGVIHEVTGEWTGALGLLVAVSVAYGVILMAATSRARAGR